MKHGYQPLRELSQESNDVLRQAFFQPETLYITQQEPTIDNTRLGESKVYKDASGDYWYYTKLSKTQMGKIQYTVI